MKQKANIRGLRLYLIKLEYKNIKNVNVKGDIVQ